MAKNSRISRRSAGFSLIELAVVVVVVGLILGAILVPLNTQLEQRRITETKTRVTQAREALIAFALANGRLPCPAVDTGVEKFLNPPADGLGTGNCAQWDGFLPAVTLGMDNVDDNGFAVDGWGGTPNRIRYAVTSHPDPAAPAKTFTRTDGMRQLTITGLSAAPDYLSVCANKSDNLPNNCGTAQPLAPKNAVAVIYSLGKNAGAILSGAQTAAADEASNLDSDRFFVSREQTTAGGEFDDHLEWISLYELVGRMVAAGQLP